MKSFAAVLSLSLATAVAAHAAPINGQFSITGPSVLDNGSSLVFNPTTINVGAASTLYGSFTSLLTAGESGTVTSPIDYTNYTPGTASLIFSNGSNSVTFELESISKMSSGVFGNFVGTGLISTSAAGYDPTMANLYFSTQANGDVTFSATAVGASPVPEPSSLALIGTGVLGAAGAIRRKLVRA